MKKVFDFLLLFLKRSAIQELFWVSSIHVPTELTELFGNMQIIEI